MAAIFNSKNDASGDTDKDMFQQHVERMKKFHHTHPWDSNSGTAKAKSDPFEKHFGEVNLFRMFHELIFGKRTSKQDNRALPERVHLLPLYHPTIETEDASDLIRPTEWLLLVPLRKTSLHVFSLN